MKHTLVGYTGFVGGNLAAQYAFDGLCNSKNIADSFGADNGLVVYSGMPAEKFLANADPAADLAVAQQAMDNIRRMKPEKLVLISTVDVYPNPVAVYEDTPAGGEGSTAYGNNRLALENWVREEYPEALILRLPGLFGKGLKKNFIYDALTLTPSMLTESKYAELTRFDVVAKNYEPGRPGFYRLKEVDDVQCKALRAFFFRYDFNALSFTDSRAMYQFYNLDRLWNDITTCLKAGLTLVNMAVEPIEAGELFELVFRRPFVNHLEKPPVCYDMRTRHDSILGGRAGYISPCNWVADDIMKFVYAWDV